MKTDSVTKEEWIRKIILDRITSGYYRENERIESIRNLADEFEVSKQTVQQAISNLTLKKILSSKHGSGTYVVPFSERPASCKLVGLLTRAKGDLYFELTQSIITNLQSCGYYPIQIDISAPESTDKLHSQIEKLIAEDPAGIIIDGDSPINVLSILPLLKGIKTGIVYRDTDISNDSAARVLTDDFWGAYIGTRHLLQLGHRDILIIPAAARLYSRIVTMLDGCQQAFQELNIPWTFDDRFIVTGSVKEDQEKLYNLFTQTNRPTAVFTLADNLAASVYFSAAKAGLSIPDDLSVVGYYNTPWTTNLHPELTSVSIRENEIGKRIVSEMFIEPPIEEQKRSKIFIRPSLITRNSTCEPAEN